MRIKAKPLSEAARREAIRRWDAVAKPLRSMGRFEDMTAQIAAIQGTADISLRPRCALIFCGDHGVVRQGVTQTDSSVTARVAASIAEGSSNISLMAAAADTDVLAVDMGMQEPLSMPGLLSCRLGPGTDDLSAGPAMRRTQAEQGLRIGRNLAGKMKDQGYRILAVGEMGIGNTTAAAAMASVLLQLPSDELTGRGAGLSDAALEKKKAAVRQAIRVNQPDPSDPVGVLAALGGFEIAGMAGAFLGAAEHGIPAVIDGAISAAAALTAVRICPEAREFMLPSHLGRVTVARRVMEALDMQPVLHGGMALGEGTGAVMLFPLLDMAAALYRGAHTFESLKMDAYQPLGGTG